MAIGRKSAGDGSKKVGELRRAQLVTTFGPGAMVDLPDMSVVVGSTDHWRPICKTISDRNLEILLGVKEFKEPVGKYTSDTDCTIPVRRFPDWHYCPKCGKLAQYWVISGADKKTCADCGVTLIPSRFVAACENGHLEDFPYRWWVHRGRDCGSKAPLKISFKKETRGIEGILIECPDCHASRTMAGCTSPDALAGRKCFGRRPWIGKKIEDADPDPCPCNMQVIQRTAANAYYPVTVSALTIPPTASSVVERYWTQIQAYLGMGFDQTTFRNVLKGLLAAEELTDSDLDEVIFEIELKGSSAGDAEVTKQRIYQSEYHALVGEDHDGTQFKTKHVPVPEGYEDLIDDVVLVKRLREIMALEGFRRISPEPSGMSREMSPLSKERLDWLPGIELLGEGVFIKLNQSAIDKWIERIGDRYDRMEKRLEKSNVKCENFSPQYVLLHTLSHALIRQLAMECGYTTSSISERIYSTYRADDRKMSGILLYTSSSDSDGSLGGLVRRGRSENLKVTLDGALSSATWCSSDPLCIESREQGYKSLNYAACHACSLLPETSCEMRNCLLDRVSLMGMPDDTGLGYFSAAESI